MALKRTSLTLAAMSNSTEIRAKRKLARLTQKQACTMVHASLRSWNEWESGTRPMHPGLWELFCIKTSQLK